MGRLRVFLLIAIVIVLIAVVVVVVLPMLNPTEPAVQTVDTTGQEPEQPSEPTIDPNFTPEPTATPIRFVELVIAVQELPRGFRIPPNAVALRLWPEDAAPFNGVTNLEDVVDKIARTDIFREQPILTNMIVDDFQSLARVGSDAAAILPNGLVAIALPIDRLTSVAYAVQDGDRVDLIISMLFVDVDEEFQSLIPNIQTFVARDQQTGGFIIGERIPGRIDTNAFGTVVIEPSERPRPRLTTQRTIQDALVVHVGNFPLDGRFIGVPPTPTPVPAEDEEAGENTPPPPTPTPPRPDIITLGVTPQEAVVLTWLIEAKVPVTLALRASTDTSRAPTTPVTLDYIMGTYGIDLPVKREYTIEPAIRSIRQLVAAEEITLSDNTQ
jgi:Flp pilus assembly protein CpaB